MGSRELDTVQRWWFKRWIHLCKVKKICKKRGEEDAVTVQVSALAAGWVKQCHE